MNALTATHCFLTDSSMYREFFEERDEILKHKWIESEKKGYDIGFNAALFDWLLHHRKNWRKFKRI